MQIVGMDTETAAIVPGRLAPPLVCLSEARREDTGTFEPVLYHRLDGLERYKRAVKQPDVCVVWMNGPFDLAVLIEEAGDGDEAEALLLDTIDAIREGRVSDIECREKLLLNLKGLLQDATDEDDARGIPLWSLVLDRLGIDIREDKTDPDAWRLRYGTLIDVPLDLWPAKARRYAEDDPIYNLRVYEHQQAEALSYDYIDPECPWLLVDERRLIMFKFSLHLMSAWGCRTDLQRVGPLKDAVERACAQLDELLLAEGLARWGKKEGRPVLMENRRVIQDRLAALHRARWEAENPGQTLTPYPLPSVRGEKVTPDGGGVSYVDPTGHHVVPLSEPSGTFPEGQVSWSRDSKLLSEDPTMVRFGQQNVLYKLKTTYMPLLEHGGAHPINPRYDELKATGRPSCKRPNMLNLPTFGVESAGYGVRECFLPRDGWCFLDADIDQAEMCGFAQFCIEKYGFSRMGEIINAGMDAHIWLALRFPELAGVDYETALKLKKAGDATVKRLRKFAKVGNFGRMGGMGASTMVDYARGFGVKLTLKEAQQVIDAFDQTWEEAVLMRRWIGQQTANDQLFTFTDPISGRKRGGVGYTNGNNMCFQPRIANLGRDVLDHLTEECYTGRATEGGSFRSYSGRSPLYGARPWVYVYDQFTLEIPYHTWGADRAHDAALRLEELVQRRGKFWCSHVAIRSQAAMAYTWTKDSVNDLEISRVLDDQGRIIPCDNPRRAA